MLLKIKHIIFDDPSTLNEIIEASKGQDHFFQLIDADKLLSEVQILAAIDHVVGNAAISKVRNMENLLLMYIAGTTQISKAIAALGLSSDTKKIIGVYESEAEIRNMLSKFPMLRESEARVIPYDAPEFDSEVFSKISHVELSL